jgi:hypothetical protein
MMILVGLCTSLIIIFIGKKNFLAKNTSLSFDKYLENKVYYESWGYEFNDTNLTY